MRKTFSKALRQLESETVVLKDPELIVGNQWVSTETEIARDVRCSISRQSRGGSRQNAGEQQPGIDILDDQYMVYFDPPDSRVKGKMNIHRGDGQVLHIVDVVPRRVVASTKVQYAICVDALDKIGQGGS